MNENKIENDFKILIENLKNDKKSEDTIKTYFYALKKFKDSNLDIFGYAKTLENRNLVSQFVNSLKYSDYKLSIKDKKTLREIHDEKPSRRAKPKEQFKVKSFFNNINRCRNIKAKLPFRLSALSGLRINELSNIRKEDVTFLEDGRIKIFVREGKGGKERTITTIMKDKYLYDNLKKHIENLKDDNRVFYSRNYLHKIAKKHNFTNHDLRKMCVQKIYYSCDYDKETTIQLVKAYLGHDIKGKTYTYYLARDVNAYGTWWDII